VKYFLPGVLLGACAERVPLDEVPITGGTEEQHAEARRILAAFEADSGEGRVVLTGVTFAPVYGEAIGTFSAVSDHIRLEPDLQGPLLERALRHELCHALDFAEELMVGPDETFDALILDLFRLGSIDTGGLGGPRYRRSEAFASYCDMGPLVAHALSSACPGEPEAVTEAAAYLTSRVWKTWDPPAAHPGPGAPHASWTAPAPDPGEFGVMGLADPAQIRVLYGTSLVDLGLDDGLPRGEALQAFAPQEELPEGLSGLCPLYGSLSDGVGWSEGPAAALVRFRLYDTSAVARILATDGGAWGLAEGCVPQVYTDLFTTADHRLWLAWVDGSTVSWAPLLE
jgi:hypothetical protein